MALKFLIVSSVGTISKPCITPINAATITMAADTVTKDGIAAVAVPFINAIIPIVTDIDNINTLIPVAVAITFLESNPLSKYRIPASSATTTDTANNPVNPLGAILAILAINANIPITADIDAAATATFLESITLNRLIASANAKIGTVIFISIVPALSAYRPANCDTFISNANTTPTAPITAIPLTMSLISKSESKRITNTSIPIAAATFNSIVPALSAY